MDSLNIMLIFVGLGFVVFLMFYIKKTQDRNAEKRNLKKFKEAEEAELESTEYTSLYLKQIAENTKSINKNLWVIVIIFIIIPIAIAVLTLIF